MQEKEKILKATREKYDTLPTVESLEMPVDFSLKTTKARRK